MGFSVKNYRPLLALSVLLTSLVSCVISDAYVCGDNMCSCDGFKAECKNKNLNYIPELPKTIEELIFVGKLPVLSSTILKPLSKLKIKKINLLSSGVTNVTSDAFANLTYLQELDLSGNKNVNGFQLAKSFYSIQRNRNLTLFLNHCGLTDLPMNFFEGLNTSNITNITMRSNRMKEFHIATYYGLKTLRHLDLSVNWLKNVVSGTGGEQSGIETLSLAENEFYLFPPPLCDNRSVSVSYFPNLKVLDFSNNFITVPRANDWYCLKNLETLNLSRNAVQILEDDVFSDLKALKTLELSHMLRKIDVIHRRAFNIPNLTQLRFQNNIQVFKPGSGVKVKELFKLLPKLEILDLGRNNLGYLNGTIVHMLSPLIHLRELNLYKTKLKKIPEDLFGHFKNLTKLSLGNNNIYIIEASAFENVTKLSSLDLSKNLIHEITKYSFPDELMKSLTEINLSENPFACNECGDDYKGENVWFRKWIDKFIGNGGTLTGWSEMYQCHTPMSKSKTLLKDYRPNPKDCKTDGMLVAYITIAVFMCLVIIFGIASYKGRWYIRYWYIKLRWRLQRRTDTDLERQTLLPQDEMVYDAYVIYHDTDAAFVHNKLQPVMENQMKYRLFIRDREPEFGAKVDIMVESIYKSNHVIAVISRRFLKDQWCEFQLAVSIDRQVEIKRDFLLLVSLEDLDKRLLSKSWCVLFTKTPTAEWCERKNSIKRKVFERQIQTTIPNRRFPRQLSQNSEMCD